MNEYNDPDHAFNGIINSSFAANPQVSPQAAPQQSYTDPHPYGPPLHPTRPVRTGLTPRGKAGLAVAATVVAGGSLLGYQHYAAAQAANQVKAQELSIQQQKLALEQQKALDKANKAAAKTQTAAETARQAKVDACVKDNKGLVGKQLGATYRSVLDDCQAQYPATPTNTGDMQEAASSSSTGSGAGASEGLLIGAGALVIGAVAFIRKASKPAQQAAPTGYVIYPNHPQK